MKQSSKERLATLLMDELLERLSERESIRRLLGDMTSLPIDDVIEHILDDFERALEAFHRKYSSADGDAKRTEPVAEVLLANANGETSVEPVVGRPPADMEGATPSPSVTEEPLPKTAAASVQELPPRDEPQETVAPIPVPGVQLDPIRLEFPKITLKVDLPPAEEERRARHGAVNKPVQAEEKEEPKQLDRLPEHREQAKKPAEKGPALAPTVEPAHKQEPEPPAKKAVRPEKVMPLGDEGPTRAPSAEPEHNPEPEPPAKKAVRPEKVTPLADKGSVLAPSVETEHKQEPEVPVKKAVRPEKTGAPADKESALQPSVTPAPKQEPEAPAKKAVHHEDKEESHARQKRDEQEKELRKLEELAMRIEAEYELRRTRQKKSDSIPPPETRKDEPAETELPERAKLVEDEDLEEEIVDVQPGGSGKHVARARYVFADDEHVYVHAVGRVPSGEEPSPDPFMLEEKGIDGRGFAFALDYEGMRFYLSKINPNEVNISRSMVLLLNKQESLQMQGVHESTLNDLRAHGILLPIEFGTVARGKDYLLGIIDKNKEDLEEALDELEKTKWWTVTTSVLDGTIAGIVGTDVQRIGRERSRERASYTSAPQGKKYDIKVLERILQREKKIAEAIHGELSGIVDRCEVETMVGLGSGSSEDWKVILKASYDVPPADLARFNRAVTDLQYHHLQYELMIAVTGDRDWLTLRRK